MLTGIRNIVLEELFQYLMTETTNELNGTNPFFFDRKSSRIHSSVRIDIVMHVIAPLASYLIFTKCNILLTDSHGTRGQ